MSEDANSAVTNSDNTIADTLDPLVEITQADTLDQFRQSYNSIVTLINNSITDQNTANLDHRLAGGNLFFGNTIVMRGPNGQFAAGDITCNNIIMTGDISGTINYIADDDNSTMIKLDGADPAIDDETIKFYAGGTVNEIATMQSDKTRIFNNFTAEANANVDGQFYLNGDAYTYGNTEFIGPVKIPQGVNADTQGLEGQFRLNTEINVLQYYDIDDGWVNAAGTLADLDGIDLTGASTNDVLTWNGSAWVAQVVTPVGTSGIDDLADVALGSPAVGDRLYWDGSVWKAKSMDITELTDINADAWPPVDGALLHYNASANKWTPNTVANTSTKRLDINAAANTLTIVRENNSEYQANVAPLFDTITRFADVHVAGLVDKSILAWSATNNRWEAGQDSGAANTSTAHAVVNPQTSAKANTVTFTRDNGTFFDLNLTSMFLTIDKFGDINTSLNAPLHHQVLRWESSINQWVPGDVEATFVDLSTNKLRELADIDLPADPTTLTDNYVLKWDASAQKWGAEVDVNDPSLFELGIFSNVNTANATLTPTKSLYLRYDEVNSEWYAGPWAANDMPELGDLADVDYPYPLVDKPLHDQILRFDQADNKWKPGNDVMTEIGSFGLNRLADVDIITNAPTEGQILKYDTATGNFIPADDTSYLQILGTITIDAMNDVDTLTGGKSVGDVLRYDGTQWTAYSLPLAPNVLADIPDVSATVATDGQVLKYNTAASEWQPADEYSYTLDITTNSIFELMDVTTSGLSIDDVLKWNGTSFEPQPITDPTYTLEDLTNVSPGPPTVGQVLKWDGSLWAPAEDVKLELGNHKLQELQDVDALNSATAGDLLVRGNGTMWESKDIGDAIGSVSNHNDIDENTVPVDENVLAYDGTSSKYVPTTVESLTRAKSSAPATSIGSAGDKAGMIAYAGDHFYWCVADFDGTSDIWKRVLATDTSW